MIEYELRTDIGTRDEQQDCAEVCTNNGIVSAVLCDGMGGHQGGTIASGLAVSSFMAAFKGIDRHNIPVFMISKTEQVNKKIHSLTDESGKRLNAGTTLVSVIIDEKKLYWISVGDSRLYIIRNSKITQITTDHNYFYILDRLLNDNKISIEEYNKKSIKGNALISYLGIPKLELIDINVEPFILFEGDILLMATDGLFKLMSDEEILGCTNDSIKVTADNLLRSIKKCKSQNKDNATFILIRMR